MSVSSLELWQRIAAEGIASAMQCRSWAAEVSKHLPAAETADGLKVLQKLIDIGKLTKYQAKVLSGQSTDSLKRGPWNVLSKVKQPQWQGWLEITKIDPSKGEQPPARWARWLTGPEMQSLQSSAPSLPRGIQLAQIRNPHLQMIEMPEMVGSELQLRVAPVVGSSLAESFQESRPSITQSLQIIKQVAEALAAMHQRRVVHGRVLPDRIFWDETNGATLVCDPISVWTASVEPGTSGVLGEHLNGLRLESFLAPEFLAPRQPPSMVSDVYALGATWWWLIVGAPPVEGSNVASTLGQAAEAVLDFDGKLSELAEPLRVCLKHCLAKNPSARFADASVLGSALLAAERSVAAGKSIRTAALVAAPVVAQVVPVVATTVDTPKPIVAAPVDTAPEATVLEATILEATVAPESTATATIVATPIVAIATSEVLSAESNKVTAPKADQPKNVRAKPTQTPVERKTESAKPEAAKTELVKPDSAKSSPAKTASAKPATAKPVAAKPEVDKSDLEKAESPTTDSPKPTKPKQTIPSVTTQPLIQPTTPVVPVDVIPVEAATVEVETTPEVVAIVAAETTVGEAVSKPTRQPVAKTSQPAQPVRRRAKRKSKAPLFIAGGFGFIAILLGILKFSGALDSSSTKNETAEIKGTFQPPVNASQPTIITKDPLTEYFRLVDSKDAPWAPPQTPQPIALDLLPPGGQLFVVIRPADLMRSQTSSTLITTLNKQFAFDQLLKEVTEASGQPVDSISSLTVAFYNAPSPEQIPLRATRVELAAGVGLDKLKAEWNVTSEAIVGQERLLVNDKDMAYYVAKDASPNSITQFSFGSAAQMKEVAELSGGAAALNAQFKQLHAKSCQQYPLVILGSPRYLFTEGRGLIKTLPKRLQNQIEPILGKDSRAGLLQTALKEQWYWELQLIGQTDAESPRLVTKLNEEASSVSGRVEQWLVEQSPHPYWRALALRYPQMLRTWREYARFGLEDGVAIANGYLPTDAAGNLLITSWVAAQDASTLAGNMTAATSGNTTPATPTMSPEDLLNKPIRLIFDQEPIERALALVGEEANTGVPAASQMRFELDGGAFERAGITRNQQLREFKIDNKPMRDALTEIAKRGNPVTTVKDTREIDQKLIWVVRDDPQNAGKKMISLTTRDTANAEKISLTKEFAPQQ